MGWNEDEDAVEALEGVCNMTDMLAGPWAVIGDGQAARPEASRDGRGVRLVPVMGRD
jgi:hypothetical protein